MDDNDDKRTSNMGYEYDDDDEDPDIIVKPTHPYYSNTSGGEMGPFKQPPVGPDQYYPNHQMVQLPVYCLPHKKVGTPQSSRGSQPDIAGIGAGSQPDLIGMGAGGPHVNFSVDN